MPRRLWLLALTLLCTCRTAALTPPRAAATDERPLPTLPDIFGPFGWTTTVDELRARYPEVRISEYAPEEGWRDEVSGEALIRVTYSAFIPHVEPFGVVLLNVVGFRGRPAGALVVRRMDWPETECHQEGMDGDARVSCIERLRRERRVLYDRMAARLVGLYGPGRLEPLESRDETAADGGTVNIEQSERCWAPPGLRLCLALGEDPSAHTGTMVRLSAVRDDRMPY